MALASRTDLANQREKSYKAKLRQKMENEYITPTIDEKGLYYALKYDYEHNQLVDDNKKKHFKELRVKYG